MPSTFARDSGTGACLVAAILLLGLISPARADPVIAYAGGLLDVGAGWRIRSVAKDGLDLEGNGVIGNDGYWTFGGLLQAWSCSAMQAADTVSG